MCRSLAQGGRRCRCTDGGAERRARDRARKAAKRAAERALQDGVRSPSPTPGGGRVSFDALAAMSRSERQAVVQAQRSGYAAHAATSSSLWQAIDDWDPDPENTGGYSSPMEQRIGMERGYVSAVQDAGRAVATVVDARLIDALADAGLSPTAEADYTRIAEEIGGAKFLKELDRRADLNRRRNDPGFGSLSADEKDEITDGLRALDRGAAGKRFTSARFAWIDADARREEIRQQVVREEIAQSVPCGGVPLQADIFTADKEPGEATTKYGWERSAPEDFTSTLEKCWGTFPDAMLATATERMGDLNIHYSSAGRVRFNPADLRRGPVQDAVVMHYPSEFMEGPQGLLAAAERIKSTGTMNTLLELPVSRSGVGSLFADKSGFPVDVGAQSLDDTPQVREAMQTYADAVNAAGGVPGADAKPRSIEVVQVPRSSSMSTPRGLVLTTSDPSPTSDPETLKGVGPVMTTGGDVGPTIHEMGHYVEAGNPQVYIACRRFRDDRSEGYARDKEIPGVGAVCNADFVDPYVSAVYPLGRSTEVFTIGMEALFSGRYGGLTGERGAHDLAFGKAGPRADEGHRELVLGLLLSGGLSER